MAQIQSPRVLHRRVCRRDSLWRDGERCGLRDRQLDDPIARCTIRYRDSRGTRDAAARSGDGCSLLAFARPCGSPRPRAVRPAQRRGRAGRRAALHATWPRSSDACAWRPPAIDRRRPAHWMGVPLATAWTAGGALRPPVRVLWRHRRQSGWSALRRLDGVCPSTAWTCRHGDGNRAPGRRGSGAGLPLAFGPVLLMLWAPIAVATAGVLIGTVVGERLLLGLSPRQFGQTIGAAIGLLGIWLLVMPF